MSTMKTILLAAALVSLILSPIRGADDPDRTKLADELLTTMRVESSFRSGWTSYPPVEGGADHVDSAEVSRAHWLKLKPAYVKAYAEVLSADELRALIAFYKSPIGQAYLDKMPELEGKLPRIQAVLAPEAAKPK
jgi:hypothetical protein